MILEAPIYKEIFGPLRIYEVQKVIKLDTDTETVTNNFLYNVPRNKIQDLMKDLAIIVPLKDEPLITLDGVLKAIPHKCPIIVVSNSKVEAPNNFRQEVDLIKHFAMLTNSNILLIHQKDSGLVKAFEKTGYHAILDEDGHIRDGKGEGMVIGIMLAKMLGTKHVGFVDADNYVPGAVNEYVKDYAAGFIMSESPYAMIRLHWRHKPKIIKKKLYFRKWGRVSEVTNKILNLLMGYLTRFETNIIVTGNAGEHAISMELANFMEFSTGYSIEPYELIYLLEKFTSDTQDEQLKDIYDHGIDILQIETLNPHFHEEKGQEHILDMLLSSMSVIYNSTITTDDMRELIKEELKMHGVNLNEIEFKKPHILPPVNTIDFDTWKDTLLSQTETLLAFERN